MSDENPTIDQLLSTDKMADVDYVEETSKLEAQYRADSTTSEAAADMGQAAFFMKNAKAEYETALAEIKRNRDVAAYNASETVQAAEDAKEAACRQKYDATISRILTDHFIPACKRMENIFDDPVSQGDFPKAKDAIHEMKVARLCSRFSSLTPEDGIAMIEGEILAPCDRYAAKEICGEIKTAISLGQNGRRPYYRDHLASLLSVLDQCQACAETPRMTKLRVARDMVENRKVQLRNFIRVLDLHSPNDGVFDQLARGTLSDFGELPWLSEKQ